MIIFREGNLFDFEHQAYAHGVNTKGIMGRGIVLQFKEEYPNLFMEYQQFCEERNPKGGEMFFYVEENKPAVYNLFTQRKLSVANFKFLKEAIRNMHMHALSNRITDIAMPAIGTGLGRLTEDDLIECLDPFVQTSSFHVTIYTLDDSMLNY